MTPMLGIMASAISGNLTPTSPVAGYKVWLDAADTATITQSSGAVSQWTDKSATAYTFTQATASYKPTTGSNTQNGKNVLTSTSTKSLISTAAASTWTFLHSAASTVFYAFKSTTTTYGGHPFCTNLSSTGNIGVDTFIDNPSNFYAQILRGTPGTYNSSNGTGASTLGTAFTYVTIISDPTNATAANRSDIRLKQGSAIKNNTQTGAANTSSPTSTMVLFDYVQGGAEGIAGTIGEILIYDSILSAGNILLNQQYLANKWGV